MQKRMDRITMAAGYGVLIIASFLKIIGGVNQRFSLLEVWIRSLISGNFLHFWQNEFSSGIGVLVGTGIFLILALLYILDAVLTTRHRSVSFLQSVKVAWLYFTMFFYFIFIQFYSSSIWLVLILILGALEFLLNRYLEDKIERDRKYAELQKIEKSYNEDRKRRLAFPGKYPSAFHQMIRRNFRSHQKNYLLLIVANALVFFTLVILFLPIRNLVEPIRRIPSLIGRGFCGFLLSQAAFYCYCCYYFWPLWMAYMLILKRSTWNYLFS